MQTLQNHFSMAHTPLARIPWGRRACLALLIAAIALGGCGRAISSPSPADSDGKPAVSADATAAGKSSETTSKPITGEKKPANAKGDALAKLKKEDVTAALSVLPNTLTEQFLFQEILPEGAEVSSWHYMNSGGQYWEGVNEADYRMDKVKLQEFYANLVGLNPNEPLLDNLSGNYKDAGLAFDLKELTDEAGKPLVRVTLERKAVNFGKHLSASDLLQGLPFPIPDLTGTKLTRFVYDAPAHEMHGGFFWLVVYETEAAMEDTFAVYEAMDGYETLQGHRTWKSDEGTACEIVGGMADSNFTLRVEKIDGPTADALDGRTYRTRVEIRLTDDSGRMY